MIDRIRLFLLTQWTSGALLGQTEKDAFFIRCDRSTMTQDDIDNGRLICLVGVATVRPAEFVIFRISHFSNTQSRNR
jgi:phage tail sheath protein FI